MQTTRGDYLFDHSWEREGERLSGLEAVFDPGTRRVFTDLGLDKGWRCWEVGAGAGSVARWLADRVGPAGHVLATDVSTKLMDGIEADNLEVRRHDVVGEEPPGGPFDLVHSRLVLEHLPGRLDALRNMAAALAPGGVLVVEDLDWAPAGAATRRALPVSAFLHAARLKLRAHGYDARFGRRLPAHLSEAGLVDVGAEGRVVVLVGGSPDVEWARLSLERFAELLLDTSALHRLPALRRLAEGGFGHIDRLLGDPRFVFVAPSMTAAWGRRPV